MFAITLKVILAFVLTAIPFAFHLWVKPRQASSTKWGNLYSVLSAIYERMKHSDNASPGRRDHGVSSRPRRYGNRRSYRT